MTLPTFSRTAAIGAALCLLVIGTQSANAQLTSAQQGALRSNCRGDFFAKCSSTSPGSAEALLCLQKNVDGLSAGCQAAVRTTMPPPTAAAPPKAATAPPPPAVSRKAVTAPPRAVTPPPPEAATAPAPRSAPPPKRAAAPPPPAAAAPPPPAAPATVRELSLRERAAMLRQCGGDQEALCKQVRPGGNRVVECLVMHRQSLSPTCRAAVAKAVQ